MKSQQTRIQGKVVTVDRIIDEGLVIIQDDIITYVGEFNEDHPMVEGDSDLNFDCTGHYIIPGFVDIHCHGGADVWCYDDPKTFADIHLKHGTTSLLPTLHYNQSHEEIIEGINKILRFMEEQDSSIAGIHMEGPYINPKYGFISAPISKVNPDEYMEILNLAGKHIKLWTLAPELDGQTTFMEKAAEYGIVFAVGHSEATAETIFAAAPLGMKIGCHLTNASGVTPNISRYEGTREVAVHEAVLLHDDFYAEVIPDQDGIHVRPLMLRLIVKTKGVDKVIIITDAVPDPNYHQQDNIEHKRDVNIELGNEYNPHETVEILNGSILTMDLAVKNMRKHTELGWIELTKMASLNPAKALHLDHQVGSIEEGKIANLLMVTQSIDIKMVMLRGKIVHDNKH
jgi:N-acetylglucosamine-6-phosphate deacetylase